MVGVGEGTAESVVVDVEVVEVVEEVHGVAAVVHADRLIGVVHNCIEPYTGDSKILEPRKPHKGRMLLHHEDKS